METFFLQTEEDFIQYILQNSIMYKANKKGWKIPSDFTAKITKHILPIEGSRTAIDKAVRIFIGKNMAGERTSTTSEKYWIQVGWSEDEAKDKATYEKRRRTKTCKEYWINKGFSADEAVQKISEHQKSVSRASKEYYKKRGISDDEAEKMLFEHQSTAGKASWDKCDKVQRMKNTCIFKEYWIEKGYSDREASLITCPSSVEYFAYTPDKLKRSKSLISKAIKNAWARGCYVDSRFNMNYTSNEEELFFSVIGKAYHNKFGIWLGEDDIKYVIADGYLKDNDGVILIEYDGTYWHDRARDDKRDLLIMQKRRDIIGVIRFSDLYVKQTDWCELKLKSDLKDAVKISKSEKYTQIRYG